jgi:indole-3-glycerol phosphate synthase
MRRHGVHTFLIGAAFMGANNPASEPVRVFGPD